MYPQPTGSIADALQRLRFHLMDVPSRLTILSATELIDKTPGKWSRKEILGHLIDSAINNLKRFTDAQSIDEPYLIRGYNQDKLVVANQYQNLPVDHLLALWKSLNTQIIYVVEAIAVESLARTVHSGDPESTTFTLGWLIEDYVAHLEHHLKTLL